VNDDHLKILTPNRGSVEHERLSSLINSMADGVIAIDENQKIAIYNGAALNILDINTPITGKLIAELLKLIDKNNQQIDLKRLITQTTASYISRDYLLPYADGSKINLYLSVSAVKLGYGHDGTKGHVILLRDITREKSLEEERDEFISVVSHELRTPVTISEGNINNAQVILDKSQDISKIKDALKLAHEQIMFLSELINDLSTLSRAEQGKLTVEIESINIFRLITELVNSYEPDATKKSLSIKTDLDPRLELLQSSKLYVHEILQNFITNAIKYTDKGFVIIGARPIANGVEFYVRDSGIGISKSDQDKVFNKFFRSEDYRTRQNNGTGLGLYITYKLARLIHAEISLQSEFNKGSIFTIKIPNLTNLAN
jgi:two-component system phosphate regulon sensor histidine kinase PhoR